MYADFTKPREEPAGFNLLQKIGMLFWGGIVFLIFCALMGIMLFGSLIALMVFLRAIGLQ